MGSRRAIFLDRDGTLIADKHYLNDPTQVELLVKAAEGLRALADLGFIFVVVSNQSGVGRGYFPETSVHAVNRSVAAQFAGQGVYFEAFYYCPHAPWDGCFCRKPLPGLINRACAELDIAPSLSFMIGDRISDVQAGVAAGVKSILLSFESSDLNSSFWTCADLVGAARQIERQSKV